MVVKAGNYAPSFTLNALMWAYGSLHLVAICWGGRGPTATLARQFPLGMMARQCLSFHGQHSNGKTTSGALHGIVSAPRGKSLKWRGGNGDLCPFAGVQAMLQVKKKKKIIQEKHFSMDKATITNGQPAGCPSSKKLQNREMLTQLWPN